MANSTHQQLMRANRGDSGFPAAQVQPLVRGIRGKCFVVIAAANPDGLVSIGIIDGSGDGFVRLTVASVLGAHIVAIHIKAA